MSKRYLLDTHMAMWALEEKSKLPKNVSKITDDSSALLFFSMVSVWEVAIKVGIGKLNFEGGSPGFLAKMMGNGVKLLDIKAGHVFAVENLPLIHRDPFDRLLVATAKTENMIILTTDENICKYDIKTIGR